MHSSETFHYTMLERVRFLLELPGVNTKFSDEFVLAHAVLPSLVEVVARLNLNQDNPIYLRHTVTLVDQQEYYVLPPCIQSVHRFAEMDEQGNITADYYPGGLMHPIGPGWYIEGNEMVIRPFPVGTAEIALWYISNGDVRTHYSTTGEFTSSTVFQLGTPVLGKRDRRVNAYAGQILRVITTDLIEERIISEHDPVGGTVTVRRPFDDVQAELSSSEAPVTYEIAPIGSQPLYDAIAIRAALKIGTAANISKAKRDALTLEYRQSIKTIGDNLVHMNQRTGKFIDRMTVDNSDLSQQWFGL